MSKEFPPRANRAVAISDLWYWYGERHQPAVRGVTLEVDEGELVALVGANGSGKTTLVKHLNGLLRPGRGRVEVLGRDTEGRPVGELARHVGFLYQHPEQQIFSPTVRDEVAFGPRNLGLSEGDVAGRVEAALQRFDLLDVAAQPPAILGYGIRRRITLASLAAMDSPILVLDEPMVGLDARGRQETVRWLDDKHREGRTILLVTHDMSLVARCAQRMIVLCEGQAIGDDEPGTLFQQTELLASSSLLAPPLVNLVQALRPWGFQGSALSPEAFAAEFCRLAESRRAGLDAGEGNASSQVGR